MVEFAARAPDSFRLESVSRTRLGVSTSYAQDLEHLRESPDTPAGIPGREVEFICIFARS